MLNSKRLSLLCNRALGVVLTFAFTTVLISCGGIDENTDLEPGTHYKFEVVNPASEDQAARIDLPFKSYAHNSIEKSIIGNNQDFNSLIAVLESELQKVDDAAINYTKNLEDTLLALSGASIDFDHFNLVFYVIYEGIGNVELTPLSPEVDSNGEIISIYIDRFDPRGGNTVIPKFTLAYKVSKAIKEIHFHNGPRVEQYKNIEGTDLTPINCQSLEYCKDRPAPPVIERINTPFREHGYNNFNTMVISESSSGINSLTSFTKSLYSQMGWNNLDDFIKPLLKANIDFNEYNLVLYRMTEGSGSITLSPQLPTVDEDITHIKINRDAPNVGTADMAYYALAYKVKKTIKTIHFNDGQRTAVIPNTAGQNIVPLNCQSWNDGCNECSRPAQTKLDAITATPMQNIAACTKKACAVYNPFICKVWD